jgi:hypothetical protein
MSRLVHGRRKFRNMHKRGSEGKALAVSSFGNDADPIASLHLERRSCVKLAGNWWLACRPRERSDMRGRCAEHPGCRFAYPGYACS